MNNKKRADRILAVLFFSFLTVTFIRKFILDNFLIELVSFTIEAALVGGIADWFAVTALFRKPLGFSWHTAVIPKNRNKVIESIINVVEKELLSAEVIKEKIGKLNIVDSAILYVEKRNIKAMIVKITRRYGHSLLKRLDKEKLSQYLESFVKRNIAKADLAQEIKNFFKHFSDSEEYNKLIASIQDELIAIIKKDSTKDELANIINNEIRNTINAATGFKRIMLEMALSVAEGTNSMNIPDAASSLQAELIEVLSGLKDESNPLHMRLKAMTDEMLLKVSSDQEVISSLEEWKLVIAERIELKPEFEKYIGSFITELEALLYELEDQSAEKLVTETDTTAIRIVNWVLMQSERYWIYFKENDRQKALLETFIKEKIYQIINAEHHLLGRMVRVVLDNFTDEALNEFIERKAGNDLHWIRINGCIVGAVSGFFFYLFVNLFYEPVIVLVIQRLFS